MYISSFPDSKMDRKDKLFIVNEVCARITVDHVGSYSSLAPIFTITSGHLLLLKSMRL